MFCQAYIIPFIISFIIIIPAVLFMKSFALKYKIMDDPLKDAERRLQSKPIPLLGGLAIFLGFFAIAAYYAFRTDRILFSTSSILAKHLIGIFIGASILMIGGFFDDKYKLRPKYAIIAPILASFVVIGSGVAITYITNPFGGIIRLDLFKIVLFKWGGLPYKISLPSDLITFFWILGMIYTTKLLDGLDGLATGITAIGAFVIFGASLSKVYVIPQVALLSIILAGACLGFLIFNFNPAKIFLGEGGSTLCGFLLAALGILSQGKVAVTLLVMGIPILDVLWVIGRRMVCPPLSQRWDGGDFSEVGSMELGLPLTARAGSNASGCMEEEDKLCRRKSHPSPPLKGEGGCPPSFEEGVRGRLNVFQADRKHLHHRLLDAGFSHRGAVLFLYLITGIFGIASLFLQSKGRFVALGVLLIVMVIVGMRVVRKYQKNNSKF
ncbi:MAG: MraY family glycosyltransferase [bacterium]